MESPWGRWGPVRFPVLSAACWRRCGTKAIHGWSVYGGAWSRAGAREPPSLRIRVPTPAAGSGAERALSLPLQIALVGCQVRLPSGARLPASSPVLSSLFSHTPTPTLY